MTADSRDAAVAAVLTVASTAPTRRPRSASLSAPSGRRFGPHHRRLLAHAPEMRIFVLSRPGRDCQCAPRTHPGCLWNSSPSQLSRCSCEHLCLTRLPAGRQWHGEASGNRPLLGESPLASGAAGADQPIFGGPSRSHRGRVGHRQELVAQSVHSEPRVVSGLPYPELRSHCTFADRVAALRPCTRLCRTGSATGSRTGFFGGRLGRQWGCS